MSDTSQVSPTPASEPTRRSRRLQQRPRRRWLRILLWVLASAVVLSVLWLIVSSLIVVSTLSSARESASRLQSSIGAQDSKAAESAAASFRDSSQLAHAVSSDVMWQATEQLPWIGSQFLALSATAEAAAEVGSNGLPPLLELAGIVKPESLVPSGGTLNLSVLEQGQPFASASAEAFASAEDILSAVDPAQLIAPLGVHIDSAQKLLHEATSVVSTLNAVTQLAPSMLGADGPRTYLLMFQNVAEARATGGMPGSFALIKTEGGRIELLDQSSPSDFKPFDPPVMKLPQGTQNVFGQLPAKLISDVNYTPDFALSGQIVQAMWESRFGLKVDGVLSVDPVALSYVLEATGPITLATGDVLTADNAVQLLLKDAYARYPGGAEQNVFFDVASAAVFEKISSGDFDGSAFIAALARSGAEHRIYIWNSAPAEQEVLAGTTLASLLPQSSKNFSGYGLYINDQTGSKMDMYLDTTVGSAVQLCRSDNRPQAFFTLTLKNTAPADAAISLPGYVTGGGNYGTEPGTIRTQVVLYGPAGSAWQETLINGSPSDMFTTLDGEYSVALFEVYLAPGQTADINVKSIQTVGAPQNISLMTTPLPLLTMDNISSISCLK